MRSIWNCRSSEPTGAARLVVAAAAVVLATTQAAEIDDHGNYQDDQVDAFDGPVVIDHPGVGQSGQRQEKEADQGNQQSVIGALQIGGEQPKQNQRHSRECQDDDYDEAGHRNDCRRFADAVSAVQLFVTALPRKEEGVASQMRREIHPQHQCDERLHAEKPNQSENPKTPEEQRGHRR